MSPGVGQSRGGGSKIPQVGTVCLGFDNLLSLQKEALYFPGVFISGCHAGVSSFGC